ncbi:MAG: phosphoribosylaminoimidazolesuccinocarboxamide synthase [Candidatus Hecatellales archaeon ex4484_218]|nr:MAG: phosphoribosylaminoimidazolesuccinocarboxamide synthase [Candidatus Hecatellales archaeon ex4484_218]
MEINLLNKIAEGKTKIVYSSTSSDEVFLKFKDDITALDGEKHNVLPGKGVINAKVSAKIFSLLEEKDIPTHFVKLVDDTTMKVKKLKMIPVEVVCRNVAAGHLVKNYPFFRKGDKLKEPLIEFFLKDDLHHDPLLSEEHLKIFGLMEEKEIENVKRITRRVNEVLREFMEKLGLQLVDFKLEFGRDKEGKLRVGDELNIDCMRLWDLKTGESLDKDVYRKGESLEKVLQTYTKVYKLIVGGEI